MTTSDTTKRRKAAQAILAARTYEEQHKALDHWELLVPYGAPYMLASQGEVEYVEGLYLQLRQFAFEWQTNQRFLDLETRIEDLESPEGMRLGDHR